MGRRSGNCVTAGIVLGDATSSGPAGSGIPFLSLEIPAELAWFIQGFSLCPCHRYFITQLSGEVVA